MRLDVSRLRNAILRNSGSILPAVVLALAALLVGTHAQAQGPPAIAVMNTATHTPLKPPIDLLYPSTIRLRGEGFAPGVTVTVHLDTRTGPRLGTAVPGKVGNFLGNFNIPMTSSGPHTIIAVQGTIQASEAVTLVSQPK